MEAWREGEVILEERRQKHLDTLRYSFKKSTKFLIDRDESIKRL